MISDSVIRAMSGDRAFRLVCARTTDTARAVAAAQAASGSSAALLGELVTGAVLVRQAMAPDLRVQVVVQAADGRSSLVADAHPDGTCRGLARVAATPRFTLGAGARIQVMRTLPGGKIHQGVVEIPEEGSISGALMAYMQESEQIVSVIAVGAPLTNRGASRDGAIGAAGGYLVQPLPEMERGSLQIMTERLSGLRSIEELLADPATSAESLLHDIVEDTPYWMIDEAPLSFGCTCSAERLRASLATIGRSDLEAMIDEGKPVEIRCEFCGKDYVIALDELRAMLPAR